MERPSPTFHPGLIGSAPQAPAPPETGVGIIKRRRGTGVYVTWLVAPSTIWLILFLIVPLLSIIVFSFWQINDQNVMVPQFTLVNYAEYFHTEGFFDPSSDKFLTLSSNILTLWTTLRLTMEVMVICLLLAYPIAYFLAMQVKAFKWQLALFLMCMVPFWTSYLIRTVAWVPMLGRRGLVNKFLLWLGIVEKPLGFLLYSEFSLTLALVQLYVVLCIGPIFFSLAKIDNSILEAARDMGAKPYQIFREIILPLSLPGVAIGMIFIWVMIMGEFATAGLVGGGKMALVGNSIIDLMGTGQYPPASSIALMLMLTMMIGVFIILKFVDIRNQL